MALGLFLSTKLSLQTAVRFPLSVRSWFLLVLVCTAAVPVCSSPSILTYRPVDVTRSTRDGIFVISADVAVQLMIFGEELSNSTIVTFSTGSRSCSVSEVDLIGGGNLVVIPEDSNSSNSQEAAIVAASLTVTLPALNTPYYFCLFEESSTPPVHQGSEPWVALAVAVPSSDLLPLWLEIIFIIALMILSGLFSGLNLGLMALDPTTLKIVLESGSKRQKTYAKLIYRVRKRGNYLLCTLLLGNVLVNSTLTILLDDVLPSGIYAVVASTLAIVLFGEIIPQAICSRHGLVVGAWTIPLTLTFMLLTFPLSFPLSLILDLVLGKEIGSVYNRDQLLKLLSVTKDHHDLENDEVDIISGALAFKKKRAKDVMTKFEDIYCIDIQSVLDFKTMKEIYDTGFSRIPVYEDTRDNLVHLLYVRDLAFVDPDDNTTLASHVQFYQHEFLRFYEDTSLDDILKGFLEGKCHLGVIQAIKEEPNKDPVYVAVGVITLEDIVEEILQREIVDETDRFVDNRTFKPRKAKTVDVGEFMDFTNTLTSQQRLAVYQFLSTEVEPFKEKYISSVVLKRLLTQKGIVQKLVHEEYRQRHLTLYSCGSPANYFCLILEGRMEVVIGKDGLIFESHAFSHFGAQALTYALEESAKDYRPDFTATPVSDCLVIIITQRQYRAAWKASQFEGGRMGTAPGDGGNDKGGGQGGSGGGNEEESQAGGSDVFSDEWAKAESTDFEVSQTKGSGLGSISKFLLRHQHSQSQQQQRSKKRKQSDQVSLLAESSSGPPSPTGSGALVRTSPERYLTLAQLDSTELKTYVSPTPPPQPYPDTNGGIAGGSKLPGGKSARTSVTSTSTHQTTHL